MKKIKIVSILIMATTLAGLWSIGCGDPEPEPQIEAEAVEQTDPYSDWLMTQNENIKLFYPAHHMHADKMEAVVAGYSSAIARNCEFLGIPIPSETLVVYYHTGFRQGEELTGFRYPFVRDSVIYYWQPNWLGPSLMDYLLRKFTPQPTRFEFLAHGLMALFDYSGQNWHELTLNQIDSSAFVGLDSLSRDTSVNVQEERDVSGPTASLVNYLVVQYGVDRFKDLYQARDSFQQAVPRLYGVSVDSLETLWIEFLREEKGR